MFFLFFRFTYCFFFSQRQKDLLEIFFCVLLSEIRTPLNHLSYYLIHTKKPPRVLFPTFFWLFLLYNLFSRFFSHQEISFALDPNPQLYILCEISLSCPPTPHLAPAFIMLHSPQWISDMSHLLAILCYFQTGLRKALNTSQISALNLLCTNLYSCWRYISLILPLRVYYTFFQFLFMALMMVLSFYFHYNWDESIL